MKNAYKKGALRFLSVSLMLAVGAYLMHVVQPKEPEVPTADLFTYTWRLHDLFDQGEFVLVSKTTEPQRLRKSVTLQWSGEPKKSYSVQLSTDPNFKDATRIQTVGPRLTLVKVYNGISYWRVSEDGLHWGETRHFRLKPDFLKDPPPQVRVDRQFVVLNQPVQEVGVQLKTSFQARGFIIESSARPDFQDASTQRFWSSGAQMALKFFAPGESYYRFRAVNASLEMTEWSLPQKLPPQSSRPNPKQPRYLQKPALIL